MTSVPHDAAQFSALSPAETSISVVTNPFQVAANMQIPPALTTKPLLQTTGQNFRTNHSLVSYEGGLFVFGGRYLTTYFNNLQRYNPTNMTWGDVLAEGTELPARRGDHSANIIGGNMIIFGGRKQLVAMDDMWSYDFATYLWKEIRFEKACGPGLVFSHASAVSNKLKMLFVAGGVHNQEAKRHLVHVFDVPGKYWKYIDGPPGINPTLIHTVQLAVDDVHERLFIMGLQDPELMSSIAAVSTQQQSPRTTSNTTASFGKQGHNNKKTESTAITAATTLMSVFYVDLQTHVWTRVRTMVSPLTPLPFATSQLANLVLPNLRMCTAAIHTMRNCWFVYVNLNPAEGHRVGTQQQQPANDDTIVMKERKFPTQYGFFVFDFNELKWSLSPALKQPKTHSEPPVMSSLGSSPFEGKYTLTTHIVKIVGGGERVTFVVFGGSTVADHVFLLMTPSLAPLNQSRKEAHEPTTPHEKPLTHTPTKAGGLSTRKRKEDTGNAVYMPFHPDFSAPSSSLDTFGLPLVRFDSEVKLSHWLQQYYKDQCKWLLERRNDVESLFAKALKMSKFKASQNALLIGKKEKVTVVSSEEAEEMISDVDSDEADARANAKGDESGGTGSKESRETLSALKRTERNLRRRSSAHTAGAGAATRGTTDAAIRKVQVAPGSTQFKKDAREAKIEKKFLVRQLLFDSVELQTMPFCGTESTSKQQNMLAKLRWKLLKSWVLSGEAVNQIGGLAQKQKVGMFGEAPLKPSMPVSSVPHLLVMSPKLSFVRKQDTSRTGNRGPSTSFVQVPQKPIPYNVPAPPPQRLSAAAFLPSGIVKYELQK